MCLWLEGYITNSHTAYDDYDRFQVWLGHFPVETSWRSIYHAFQNINSGKFQLYDFKSAHINQEKYGKDEAPIVNLQKYKDSGVPLAMFTGKTDELDDLDDVEWTKK